MDNQLERLRVAYEMAKVRKRMPNGRAYTDREVAREYLTQNSSMISKVLSGSAKSERVVGSLIKFIKSVDPSLLE
jgi:hypothetical protein